MSILDVNNEDAYIYQSNIPIVLIKRFALWRMRFKNIGFFSCFIKVATALRQYFF